MIKLRSQRYNRSLDIEIESIYKRPIKIVVKPEKQNTQSCFAKLAIAQMLRMIIFVFGTFNDTDI